MIQRREVRGALQRALGVSPREKRDAETRSALRRLLAREQRGIDEVELPDGCDLENEHGVCFLRRIEYPVAERHGARQLGVPVHWPRIAELARDDELDVDLADCLFLDTETTGLAGGAGTVVFMCGLGFFEGEHLVLEQVFLRAFGEEPAALAHIARRLAERQTLVTFVGKSFDRHRIAARMTLHKIEAPVLTDRHLDLYHLTRRAYGKQLPDCKLRTVEEQLLGVYRVGDLPGALAPAAFVAWLRDKSGQVDEVFEHNRLDVLSLVTLLGVLGESQSPGC